jgi:CBS domain-containing protein
MLRTESRRSSGAGRNQITLLNAEVFPAVKHRRSQAMRVSEAMTRNVRIANPQDTIQQVARIMAEIDAGVLPVGENDQLVGMITDRDIAVRGIAEGKGPEAKVREVMTADVKYCFEDEDVDDVVQNMSDIQVRRLPVMNRDKRLVGIISLGDIAISSGPEEAGEALSGISQPGGEHSQTG